MAGERWVSDDKRKIITRLELTGVLGTDPGYPREEGQSLDYNTVSAILCPSQ